MPKLALSEKEMAAIEDVKRAVRDLPRGIFLGVDDNECVLEFWKRTPRGVADAVMVAKLRAKNKVDCW
ncbi:MAG: hypothetical protein OEV91_06705 [Desulfobulbaceae bacterium]|nr:hypothetical protein [Desulfobulbaceae bacterium]